MTDIITSPSWHRYLSVRTTNCLWWGLKKGRDMNYIRDCHKNIEIDFDSHTDETIRPLIKELIEKKLLLLWRVKGLGKKSIKEIHEWCGIK